MTTDGDPSMAGSGYSAEVLARLHPTVQEILAQQLPAPEEDLLFQADASHMRRIGAPLDGTRIAAEELIDPVEGKDEILTLEGFKKAIGR